MRRLRQLRARAAHIDLRERQEKGIAVGRGEHVVEEPAQGEHRLALRVGQKPEAAAAPERDRVGALDDPAKGAQHVARRERLAPARPMGPYLILEVAPAVPHFVGRAALIRRDDELFGILVEQKSEL